MTREGGWREVRRGRHVRRGHEVRRRRHVPRRMLRGGRPAALSRFIATSLVALGALLWSASTTLAASPAPSAGAGGDPRSSGQGPGLVGDPGFALVAVVLIGVTSVLVTLAWVRLTAHRST